MHMVCFKKYHETNELDPNEIYPYRIEGLGKNHIPSTTNFELIDEFIKVSDEKVHIWLEKSQRKKEYSWVTLQVLLLKQLDY